MHPGYIWGDSVRIYFEWQAQERGGDVTWQDIYDERAAETALGYLPHSSEIAGAVVFFASPLAKCVTGTALPVNAGHWMPPSASGACPHTGSGCRSGRRCPPAHPAAAAALRVAGLPAHLPGSALLSALVRQVPSPCRRPRPAVRSRSARSTADVAW